MTNEYFRAGYFLIFTVILSLVALIYPANEWDIIGYLAAAKSYETQDKVELHTFVYDELRKAVPEEAYSFYIDSPYKKAVSEDPESLSQTRVFYQIRPAFVFPIFLLSKIGVNMVFAARLITALPVFLGLWIFYRASYKHIDSFLIIMMPFFALALGAFVLARSSTPDGLAFLAVAVIFYLLLKDHQAVLLILPLSLLIRTDLIIFVLLILIFLFITHIQWRLWIVVISIFSLLLYFGINQYYGSYGYAALLWNTFMGGLAYPAETNVILKWSDYQLALVSGLRELYLFNKSLLVYITLLALSILLYFRMRNQNDGGEMMQRVLMTISLLSFLSIVIHFFLFPKFLSRFFGGQYFLGAVVFLMILTESLSKKSRSTTAKK